MTCLTLPYVIVIGAQMASSLDCLDRVLSDVHVRCFEEPNETGMVATRFLMRRTDEDECKRLHALEIDEDGDMVLPRRREDVYIIIEHSLATRLANVGRQIWPGALLMADFISYHSQIFEGVCAIELGCGAGITSIVLAQYTNLVFCTDVDDKALLDCCQRNVTRNQKITSSIVNVRALDWADENSPQVLPSGSGLYDWSATEIKQLEDLDVLIAADVVYSDHLTEMFISKVQALMHRFSKCKCCYVAVEKRYNFTLAELDVVAPAFDHFDRCLRDLCEGSSKFTARRMPTDFPTVFDFERSSNMELWSVQRVSGQKHTLESDT